MLPLIFLSAIPLVFGHGGMLWPPIWQDGQQVPLEDITSISVFSDPVVKDPTTGKPINNIRSWLTDQAFVGGYGLQYAGVGEATNPEEPKGSFCARKMTPWASPGRAASLGGGCGLFIGQPYGCKGVECRKKPRAIFAQGSSALDIDFPQAKTTEWELGSLQEVAWAAKGNHMGGYTYRLCKLPQQGKKGITEECFVQNVLKFATPYTMMRDVRKTGTWKKIKQNDLTQSTYPAGSAWRHIVKATNKDGPGILRKDTVSVPADLAEGEYVLSLRWDTTAAQIWVSCANIRLVLPA